MASSTFLIQTFSLILLIILSGLIRSHAFQPLSTDFNFEDSSTQKHGYIQFEVEPDTAYLYFNFDYNTPIVLTEGKKLKLATGTYRMIIFGKYVPDRYLSIKVSEDDLQIIQVKKDDSSPGKSYAAYAALKWGKNLMVYSDEETIVSIRGTNYQGVGSLTVKLPPGVHRVLFMDRNGKTDEWFVEVNSYQLTTIEKHFKPVKNNSVLAGIIPGASQLYKREYIKSLSVFAAIGVSTGLAIHYDRQIGTESENFSSVLKRYQVAMRESVALELGNELDRISGDINSMKRNRNIFRTAAILFYAANFADAFRSPRHGFARSSKFDPYRDFSVDLDGDHLEAKLSVRF